MAVHVYVLIVLVCAAERIVELAVGRHHLRWVLGRGGVRYGSDRTRALLALHIALFTACVLEADLSMRTFRPVAGTAALVVVALAVMLRWWCILALGPRWTVGIWVIPGLPPVRTGPYRRLAHPGHLADLAQAVALPLVFGGWITAVAFVCVGGPLLHHQARTETAALAAAYPT